VSQFEEALAVFMPDDWRVTHVIELNRDDWQVNCTDDDHVVVATGTNIQGALEAAREKIETGSYAEKINYRPAAPDAPKINLLSRLGMNRPKVTPGFVRRV